jgi:hypothetical protein
MGPLRILQVGVNMPPPSTPSIKLLPKMSIPSSAFTTVAFFFFSEFLCLLPSLGQSFRAGICVCFINIFSTWNTA